MLLDRELLFFLADLSDASRPAFFSDTSEIWRPGRALPPPAPPPPPPLFRFSIFLFRSFFNCLGLAAAPFLPPLVASARPPLRSALRRGESEPERLESELLDEEERELLLE